MSAVQDMQMEEDAAVIRELQDIWDGMSDYLSPDDESVPRLAMTIRKMRDLYYERYGEDPS
jgi:hypothetical protein